MRLGVCCLILGWVWAHAHDSVTHNTGMGLGDEPEASFMLRGGGYQRHHHHHHNHDHDDHDHHHGISRNVLSFRNNHNRNPKNIIKGNNKDKDKPLLLTCGTSHSEAPDEEEFVAYLAEWRQQRRASEPKQYMIPVCFHVMESGHSHDNSQEQKWWSGDNNLLSNLRQELTVEQMQAQLDYLNRAFGGSSCCTPEEDGDWCTTARCSPDTGFVFQWANLQYQHNDDNNDNPDATQTRTVPNATDPGACVLRHAKGRWSTVWGIIDVRARLMKRRFRHGAADTLNVYWTTILRRSTAGFATFPQRYRWRPKLDGIVMDRQVVTGGTLKHYTRGAMLVHEVGHWLNLYHTFQRGCDRDRNDRVHDTPAEAEAFFGCGTLDGFPVDRDSCPDVEGLDPTWNFLDYSFDECALEFTPQQIERMQAAFERYRLGK